MALHTDTIPGSNGGNGEGIVVRRVTINTCQDISGQIPFQSMSDPCDIGVRLTFNTDRGFERILTISGTFRRDERGQVTGWGGASAVAVFLKEILGFHGALPDDNHIPAELIADAPGKEMLVLSYVTDQKKDNGKAKWAEYKIVGSADAGPEALKEKFRADVKRGFPRNFAGELRTGDDTSFPPVTSDVAAA